MTTGTLAAIILGIVLCQLLIMGLIGYFRRRRDYQALEIGKPSTTESAQPVRAPSQPVQAEAKPSLAWDGYREFEVRQRVCEDEACSVCSFYLAPVDGAPLADFKPGQFLTFKLPQASGATQEKPLIRCYSLSDRPRGDHYRVSIKRVTAPAERADLPPGRGSHYFHEQVQVGSRLQVKAPGGHFYLIDEPPLPVVLIAGGIGITPMLSMLASLLENGSRREIWLFYGVRNGSEAVMKDQLQAWAGSHANFHLHLCYSRPETSERLGVDYQHHGRVDIPLLVDSLKLARYQFYVCGPKAMMESIVPGLQALGIDDADIHYESFGPASLIKREKPVVPQTDAVEAKQMVDFHQSGRQVRWDSAAESLLAFAEAQNIPVTSGCRAGSCGSCQTLIESGEVEYTQAPDAEIDPGHCLLCISKPKGDLSLAL